MKIRLSPFAGMAPRVGPRLLPETAAQVATNCNLASGDLVPWNGNAPVVALGRSGTTKTIYPFDGLWLSWSGDVDVTPGPVNTNVPRVYYTGDGVPKATDADLARTGVGAEYPLSAYALGVPEPNAAPTAVLGPGNPGTGNSRVYIETFVSTWGEEGSASLPSAPLVSSNGGAVTLTLNATNAPSNVVSRNIYRTVAGEYKLLATLPIASTSYNDTTLDDDLGRAYATADFLPPPATLAGLVSLPNGCLVGFTGNTLCYSEPNKPYAWPVAYQQTTDSNIVGLGVVGSAVVVTTNGGPYLAMGTDPLSVTMVKLPHGFACLSKRGIVGTPFGVVYPGADGLVLVDQSGGTQVVTHATLSREDWVKYLPSTMVGAVYDSRYFGFYKDAQTHGCVIVDLRSGGVSTLDIDVNAAFTDISSDLLYLVEEGRTTVSAFSADQNTKLVQTWRSKKFVSPRMALSAMRVLADHATREDLAAYNTYLADLAANIAIYGSAGMQGGLADHAINTFSINGVELNEVAEVTRPYIEVKVYGDGVLRMSREVRSDEPFRINGGFSAREWEIEVTGTLPVHEVVLAPSVAEVA